MAKTAASEELLGDLHARVALVFMRVLKLYEARMDVCDMVAERETVDEVLTALMDSGLEPNPAMMGAITKFLKDNAIAFATNEIDALSDTEQRLAARRASRPTLVDLTALKVGNG